MLIVDGVLMAILTWYIEAVNPGGEGVPQKPYFFILVFFVHIKQINWDCFLSRHTGFPIVSR